MKKIILLAFFLGAFQNKFFALKFSETDTIRSKYQLTPVVRSEYEKFEPKFINWFYKVYCVKVKIKLSCAGCSNFFILTTFKVDSAGKIKIIETGEGKYCEREMSEKQKKEFLKGFNTITFPGLFYGKVFVFNFNRALKC
jgi:hypothetical protein